MLEGSLYLRATLNHKAAWRLFARLQETFYRKSVSELRILFQKGYSEHYSFSLRIDSTEKYYVSSESGLGQSLV